MCRIDQLFGEHSHEAVQLVGALLPGTLADVFDLDHGGHQGVAFLVRVLRTLERRNARLDFCP